jgi:anti-anti-sigma regulatory factor
MSDFRVTESDKGGGLILAGSLTVENASEIRKKLIGALVGQDEIVVCIEADASVDVTFLQILCSAHRTASKLGKSFTLRYPAPGNFLAAIGNAGFSRKSGCARERDTTCLWAGGGK